MPNKGVSGRVAVVTGGARGIGATYSESLAAAGAKVVVADLLDGTAVVDRIKNSSGQALYCHCDVTSDDSINSLAKSAKQAFGTIDILVNNAALFADLPQRSFLEIPNDEWNRVMAVNVRGPFQCVKAIAPIMIEKRHGRIVNISSGTVFKGVPNMLHYVTSKGAIVAMTRVLARELGPYNICVNAIAPGLTMSEAIASNPNWTVGAAANVATRAIQRDQVPSDLVSTLIYLCADESVFVTGQTISVDGGSVMR